jgi:hypothetical protein
MGERAVRERVPQWIDEMRRVASRHPATGACAVGTALEMWAWTFDRLHAAAAESAAPHDGSSVPMADALGLLLSARAFVLQAADAGDQLLVDMCHAHVVRTCGEVGRACAELVFGSLRHPAWEIDSNSCYHAADLEMLEQYVPGLASCARAYSDVIEADGSHLDKAGPCVRFEGFEEFVRLRTRLDGCLAGGFIARQRAAAQVRQRE